MEFLGNVGPWELILLLVYLLSIALYYLPIIIAFKKRHNQKGYIVLINILFGWTIIGWIIALVWATRPAEKGIKSNNNGVITK